jgi:hypothetical protein
MNTATISAIYTTLIKALDATRIGPFSSERKGGLITIVIIPDGHTFGVTAHRVRGLVTIEATLGGEPFKTVQYPDTAICIRTLVMEIVAHVVRQRMSAVFTLKTKSLGVP